jgi:hypothetical protein
MTHISSLNLRKIISIEIFFTVFAAVDCVLPSLLNGLVNYWPITVPFNAKDVVGGANLSPLNGAGYAPDRFGQANGAIRANSQTASLYWQAPTGSYFSSDFSVSFWVYKRTCNTWGTVCNALFLLKL